MMKRADLKTHMRKNASILAASTFIILGTACSQAEQGETVKTAPPQAVEAAAPQTATTSPALQEAERVITTAEGLEAKARELQDAAADDGGANLSVSGDAEAGKRVFAVCQSCHTTQAGRNGLGPSLAGLVGREAGSVEGFNYSDALKSSGVTWTPENLDKWLRNSAEFIPGNRMAQLFRPGVQDDQKRADVIAYLGTQ